MPHRSRQATTPMDPRVLDYMMPMFTEQYGNPHSRTHAYGWEAEKAVDLARQARPSDRCLSLDRAETSGARFCDRVPELTCMLAAPLSCAPQNVASLIGADAKDVVFTSGATESNNMIIKGIARFYGGKRNHLITTVTVRPVPPLGSHTQQLEGR